MINKFRGKYLFLSNMYECPIVYRGLKYRCAEAAFQSAKTLDTEEQKRFTAMDGPTAKKYGYKVKLRDDWKAMKFDVMVEVVEAKFQQNPALLQKLIATGQEELVEGNTWGDTYWGRCNGYGQNNLGKILMELRGSYQ